MLTPGTQSFIGVARNGVLVSDAFTALTAVRTEYDRICTTMHSIGLEPDVKIVTFDVTTTIGELTDYDDPATVHAQDDEG